MEVVTAEVAGMCFGVRDALAALAEIDRPDRVTIFGELVHNPIVSDRLKRRGFRTTGENERACLPDTDIVLITAHGVSDRERDRLKAAGKTLIDTTCPLVVNAHRAAIGLRDRGFHVVVVGRAGHVEVRGIVEDLPSFDVVERADDVKTYSYEKIGIVCQTTARACDVAAIRAAVADRNPSAVIEFVDTVCRPTKDHQRSLETLLTRVDAMVVVGGANSNNTRELVKLCGERGVRAIRVQSAAELDPAWFKGARVVGLTAGTSTLDESIAEVREALQAIDE